VGGSRCVLDLTQRQQLIGNNLLVGYFATYPVG
jgi:hypothetical protein